MQRGTMRFRFTILTVLLIITFTSIGLYTQHALSRIEVNNLTENQLYQLESLMLQMRRNEKDFLAREISNPDFYITRESKYLSRFEQNHHKAISLIDELKSSGSIQRNQMALKIDSISTYLKRYHKIFFTIKNELLVQGFKDYGLVGQMREAIHKIENTLKRQNDDKLMVYMLMSRRHEKDFLIRKDLKYKDKFTEHLVDFKMAIERSAYTQEVKQEMLVLLNDYEDTFVRMVSKKEEIGLDEKSGLMGQLRSQVHQVEPLLNESKIVLMAAIKRSTRNTNLMTLAFIVFGASVVVFFSIYIFKGVRKLLGAEPFVVAQIAQQVAAGNLVVDDALKQDSKGVLKAFVIMIDQLEQLIHKVAIVSNRLNTTGQALSSSSKDLSHGAQLQASSLQEIATTMEEISANISQNSINAQQTNQSSKATKEELVQVNNNALDSLSTVRRINEQVSTITEIAQKTNILALNAAVEASRAGDHGRGFSVVAQEVRKLAEHSKQASDEIVNLSSNSLSITEVTSKRLLVLLPELNTNSERINEISNASTEQSNGVQQVSSTLQQINRITQENAHASEHLNSSVNELAKQSEELLATIKRFKIRQAV
ncbi:methyl-accepting chemotaxis protein [Carboxylicivirga sp. N1Y90]|uniref:methyl-accepting chemotaxis protein n=1 Tax=Carboxylicivirga fragile TaxID=3417571 RepID=UPI003D351585|nr:hypothetical protein [Marinilabiliaceae bacterium N1Y90]